MLFPFAIEPSDDTHSFGVVFPDCPGCISAGDTLDEAFANAKEAVEGWLECVIDDGEDIPEPLPLSEHMKAPEYAGWIFGVVEVDLPSLSDKAERVNITLPARVLRRLDNLAKNSGDSRSSFIARMVLTKSEHQTI